METRINTYTNIIETTKGTVLTSNQDIPCVDLTKENQQTTKNQKQRKIKIIQKQQKTQINPKQQENNINQKHQENNMNQKQQENNINQKQQENNINQKNEKLLLKLNLKNINPTTLETTTETTKTTLESPTTETTNTKLEPTTTETTTDTATETTKATKAPLTTTTEIISSEILCKPKRVVVPPSHIPSIEAIEAIKAINTPDQPETEFFCHKCQHLVFRINDKHTPIMDAYYKLDTLKRNTYKKKKCMLKTTNTQETSKNSKANIKKYTIYTNPNLESSANYTLLKNNVH